MTPATGTVIVDGGPLYADVDADDEHHGPCATFLSSYSGPLVVPQLVVAEVAHLVESRLGTHAELLFLADLADGAFCTEPVLVTDWARIVELVARYQDFPLGTVDASIVTCAERLGVTKIATTDHRHFAVVRPDHAEAFMLLP